MIPIIVSARMSSRRLPGKSLRMIASKPLLQWAVDSLARNDAGAPVIVATSVDASDDPIDRWCASRGIPCHRGPLDDLATRFLQAARLMDAAAFVRISGDSPLIDPALATTAMRLFEAADVDLVTNTYPRSFPKGFSVEAIRAATLEALLARDGTDHDREHVTPAFYRNAHSLRIVTFTSGADMGDVQLSVDTEEDFRSIEQILMRTENQAGMLGWRRIRELLPQRPVPARSV